MSHVKTCDRIWIDSLKELAVLECRELLLPSPTVNLEMETFRFLIAAGQRLNHGKCMMTSQPRRYATLATPITTRRCTAFLIYSNSTQADSLIIAIRCVNCKELLACKPTTSRSPRRKLIDAEAAARVFRIVLVVQVKNTCDCVKRDLTRARTLLAF